MTIDDDAPALSCGRCRYWQPGTESFGQCRRQPPVVDFTDEGPMSAWPGTAATDWCGKFRPDLDPAPSVAGQPRPGDRP
jgi:hypothetical protein